MFRLLRSTGVTTVMAIDALDECKDEGLPSVILSVLGRFVEQMLKVKFLITDQPEPRIKTGFCLPLLLDSTDAFVLHDICPSIVNSPILQTRSIQTRTVMLDGGVVERRTHQCAQKQTCTCIFLCLESYVWQTCTYTSLCFECQMICFYLSCITKLQDYEGGSRWSRGLAPCAVTIE